MSAPNSPTSSSFSSSPSSLPPPPAPYNEDAHPILDELRRFLSGAISGTITSAVLQPLDVIKTTQQSRYLGLPSSVPDTSSSSSPSPSTSSSSSHSYNKRRHQGLISTAASLVRNEGTGSLWKGLGATNVRVFFGAGIYFVSLHRMDKLLGGSGGGGRSRSGSDDTASSSSSSEKKKSTVRSFIAGVAARTIAAAVMSPVAVVKTRMEGSNAQSPIYRQGTLAAVHTIGKQEGFASLYSGLLPTVVRDAPFSGLYYAAYTRFKEILSSSTTQSLFPSPLHPAGISFIAGVSAGACATLLTHPADVLKTRLQLKDAKGRFVDGRVLWAEAKSLLATEGIAGLLVGVGARITKRALSTAITWTLFEEAMRRSGGSGGGGG